MLLRLGLILAVTLLVGCANQWPDSNEFVIPRRYGRDGDYVRDLYSSRINWISDRTLFYQRRYHPITVKKAYELARRDFQEELYAKPSDDYRSWRENNCGWPNNDSSCRSKDSPACYFPNL